MTSHIGKGAATPFIEINLAGLQLNNDENTIIDLTNERVNESVSKAVVVTLYDDTAVILEDRLHTVKDPKITYCYGYEGISRSKEYTGQVLTYSIDFTGQGVELTVNAQAEASLKAMNPSKRSFSKKRIDEIIEELSELEGWKFDKENVAECKPVFQYDRKGMGRDNYRIYYQENESAIEFVKRKLIPDAVTPENEGNFMFRLEENEMQEIVVYFKPMQQRAEEANRVKAKFTYNLGAPNEDVISFKPEFSKMLSSLLGSAAIEGEFLNNDTGEYIRVDAKTKDGKVQTGVSQEQNPPADENANNQIVRRLAGVSYSTSHLEVLARNTYQRAANLAYPAELIIRGNTILDPDDVIEIEVITKQGYLHHSSGRYRIVSIRDEIMDGKFNSNCNLYKEIPAEDNLEVTITGPGSQQEGQVTPTEYSGNQSIDYDGTTIKKEPSGEQRRVGNKTIPKGVPDSKVLQACLKYLGIPYKWGGKSVRQGGLDCSGLTVLVYKDLGATLPAGTYAQAAKGKTIPLSTAKPGDLCFWDYGGPNTHVAVYLGNNYICEEPKTGLSCRIIHISKKGKLGRVKRYDNLYV